MNYVTDGDKNFVNLDEVQHILLSEQGLNIQFTVGDDYTVVFRYPNLEDLRWAWKTLSDRIGAVML